MATQSLLQDEAAYERGLVDSKCQKIAAQIDEVRSLNKDQLRQRWEAMFKKPVPQALTKNLLARMIAYRIQERAFGGLDRETEKLLQSYARGDKTSAQQLRRLRSGTVLLREYQGVRHTVTVADGGFIWNDKKYPNLSTIAKEITGTSWNGPRFFGLREKDEGQKTSAEAGPSQRRAKP
jgi:hypothetical protein